MGPQIVWKILSDGNWVMMSNGCEKLSDELWVMSDEWWKLKDEKWLAKQALNLSLSHFLCFSRSTVPHQSPLTSTSIFPLSTPNLDRRCLISPVIISSDKTDLCLVGKRPLSLFLSHDRSTPVTNTSIFPLSTPNLDSRYLASPIIISLIRKHPKSSLRCFQPQCRKFSYRFQLWLCKKVSPHSFSFYFLNFLFTYVSFFLFSFFQKNWHIHSSRGKRD